MSESNQRYQEIRVRFDQCFAQSNSMNDKLDQCQSKLSMAENNVQKLERDLEVSQNGNNQLQVISQENRTLSSRVQTL